MPQAPTTPTKTRLSTLVRTKYPGVYDDLDDDALEKAIVAKYPGKYDDLVGGSSGNTLLDTQNSIKGPKFEGVARPEDVSQPGIQPQTATQKLAASMSAASRNAPPYNTSPLPSSGFMPPRANPAIQDDVISRAGRAAGKFGQQTTQALGSGLEYMWNDIPAVQNAKFGLAMSDPQKMQALMEQQRQTVEGNINNPISTVAQSAFPEAKGLYDMGKSFGSDIYQGNYPQAAATGIMMAAPIAAGVGISRLAKSRVPPPIQQQVSPAYGPVPPPEYGPVRPPVQSPIQQQISPAYGPIPPPDYGPVRPPQLGPERPPVIPPVIEPPIQTPTIPTPKENPLARSARSEGTFGKNRREYTREDFLAEDNNRLLYHEKNLIQAHKTRNSERIAKAQKSLDNFKKTLDLFYGEENPTGARSAAQFEGEIDAITGVNHTPDIWTKYPGIIAEEVDELGSLNKQISAHRKRGDFNGAKEKKQRLDALEAHLKEKYSNKPKAEPVEESTPAAPKPSDRLKTAFGEVDTATGELFEKGNIPDVEIPKVVGDLETPKVEPVKASPYTIRERANLAILEERLKKAQKNNVGVIEAEERVIKYKAELAEKYKQPDEIVPSTKEQPTLPIVDEVIEKPNPNITVVEKPRVAKPAKRSPDEIEADLYAKYPGITDAEAKAHAAKEHRYSLTNETSTSGRLHGAKYEESLANLEAQYGKGQRKVAPALTRDERIEKLRSEYPGISEADINAVLRREAELDASGKQVDDYTIEDNMKAELVNGLIDDLNERHGKTVGGYPKREVREFPDDYVEPVSDPNWKELPTNEKPPTATDRSYPDDLPPVDTSVVEGTSVQKMERLLDKLAGSEREGKLWGDGINNRSEFYHKVGELISSIDNVADARAVLARLRAQRVSPYTTKLERKTIGSFIKEASVRAKELAKAEKVVAPVASVEEPVAQKLPEVDTSVVKEAVKEATKEAVEEALPKVDTSVVETETPPVKPPRRWTISEIRERDGISYSEAARKYDALPPEQQGGRPSKPGVVSSKTSTSAPPYTAPAGGRTAPLPQTPVAGVGKHGAPPPPNAPGQGVFSGNPNPPRKRQYPLAKIIGDIGEGLRENTKFGGFLNKNPKLKEIMDAFRSKRSASKIIGEKARADFEHIAHYTKTDQDWIDFERAVHQGRYPEVRKFFDDLHDKMTQLGIPVEYKKGYIPQMWEQQPTRKAWSRNKTVNQYASFMNKTTFPDYATGFKNNMKAALSPIEVMEWYAERSNKLLADHRFINDMHQAGYLTTDRKRAPTWENLDSKLQGFGQQRAHPAVRKIIENYLNDTSSNWFSILDKKMGKLNNMRLSAGVPFAPALTYRGRSVAKIGRGRAMMDRGIRGNWDAIKTGFGSRASKNYLKEMVNERAAFAEEFDYTDSTTDTPPTAHFFDQANNWFTKSVNWGSEKMYNMFEKPLLEYYMPAQKFKSTYHHYNEAIKQGMTHKEAGKLAVKLGNEAFGGGSLDALYNNKHFNTAMRTAFLSPSWLRTNVSIGKGLGKALVPRKWSGMSKYERNRYLKIYGRATAAYVAANLYQKATSGQYLFENDAGHKMDIMMGKDSMGRQRYDKLFPTSLDALDVGMNAAGSTVDRISGKNPYANPASDVIDYFGNRVGILPAMFKEGVNKEDYMGRPNIFAKYGKYNRPVPASEALANTFYQALNYGPQQISAPVTYATGFLPFIDQRMNAEEALNKMTEFGMSYGPVRPDGKSSGMGQSLSGGSSSSGGKSLNKKDDKKKKKVW